MTTHPSSLNAQGSQRGAPHASPLGSSARPLSSLTSAALTSAALTSVALTSVALTFSASELEARPARVAALRFQEGEGLKGGAYLSQVPALSLRKALGERVKALSGAELAAALPADLDLSACGERCPQVIASAVSADLITQGALHQLGESYRARVLYSDALTGEVLIDELIAAPSLEALEGAMMSKGRGWAKALEEHIKRAEASPLRLASASSAGEAQKARWSSLGVSWAPLKGGVLQMGSLKGEASERPVHSVQLAPFSLMTSEVTVAQYTACVEAGACTAPKEAEGCPSLSARSNAPVTCVSWRQASDFATWLGARLPTEAEWELAARGEAGRTYPWGEEPASCERALMLGDKARDDKTDWGEGCGAGEPTAVCTQPKGNSPEGLCDLAGSVWEWVADDWHRDYHGAPTSGAWCEQASCAPMPRGAKVYRGGGWYHGPQELRGASRGFASADFQGVSVGFRCAL